MFCIGWYIDLVASYSWCGGAELLLARWYRVTSCWRRLPGSRDGARHAGTRARGAVSFFFSSSTSVSAVSRVTRHRAESGCWVSRVTGTRTPACSTASAVWP